MGGRAQAEGLSARPLWAPRAEQARVPFLNINEQAQECLPHSGPRAGRRVGGAGREETACRPSQTHLPSGGSSCPAAYGRTAPSEAAVVCALCPHTSESPTNSRIMHCRSDGLPSSHSGKTPK